MAGLEDAVATVAIGWIVIAVGLGLLCLLVLIWAATR